MLSLAVITSALLFSISFLLVLFFGILFPGFLLKRIIAPHVQFTNLESALVALALGIGLIDISLLVLGWLSLPLTDLALGLWYLILLSSFLLTLRFRKISLREETAPLLTSKKEFRAAVVFILLLFFVKVFYLSGTILPTSTDLGHHLYWAKLTSDTQNLPVYEKQEIIQTEAGKYTMSEPTAISDFIIGEHLPLSFIHIFTGASYFGTFPVLFLFLLNLGSVFALALLFFSVGRIITKEDHWKTVQPSSFFLLGLFVFGGLFSLASPEMKFVSGGVIGNLFGNLFIPLILLVLLRALNEKNAALLAIGLFLSTILAYTHHLSTFILLFVLLFTALSLLIFWQKQFFVACQDWFHIARKSVVLATLASIFCFALFVTLPTYIETNAVQTAVGTPTKETRTGLTLTQISLSNSAFTLGFAIFSLLLIARSPRLRKNLGAVMLFGYGLVLLIMTLTPQLLLVDIPSTRIAHYLSFPLTLLALFTILYLLERSTPVLTKNVLSGSPYLVAFSIVVWLALVAPGLEDNGKTLTVNSQGLSVQETFSAARYAKEHIAPNELVLKDHNFIQASDTWMKLFFNQGYNYPLSRSFFKRYEDNPDREHCTLAMIATPNTVLGKQCYQDLPVRFIIVNPKFDQAQFLKSPEFSLVYSSANIAIFQFEKNNTP